MEDGIHVVRQSDMPPQIQSYKEFTSLSGGIFAKDDLDQRIKLYATFFAEDGSIAGLKFDIAHVQSIFMNMSLLAEKSMVLTEKIPSASQILFTFDTAGFLATNTGLGGGGACMLQFFSPFGMIAQTVLGPGAVANLTGTLQSFLATLPNPPQVNRFEKNIEGLTTPGSGSAGSSSVEYFGEHYPRNVVEALGILTIRSNLLDRSLFELFKTLCTDNFDYEQEFYSIINIDRRFINVLALAQKSELPEDVLASVKKAIKKGRRVCSRRNAIVHADWEFHEGVLKAERRMPDAVTKSAVGVTASDINSLSAEYMLASTALLGAAGAIKPADGAGYSLRTVVPSNMEDALKAVFDPLQSEADRRKREFGWTIAADDDAEQPS
ncbi:hypothetical protein C8J46_1035 [Sphingomonas sp. PP-F2F-A104-K0414]|uniref:hypothetical protein n=1 Tax=Sphingomonas sp. PP-F2F-A104-K0414 TaxID=2135661 RepID=UPI0010473EF9|nr:hypothetical protein [Sphingomonas sp. PP-F2F-A104-K0414]TCP99120.1 hypothetical protein C8J46_1035 [Sphingomonas sp. PP-F2F-A104-K0414]